MRTKRFGRLITALVMFAGVFMTSMAGLVGNASAATITWTGGGSDNNFSTGANWSGGSAPTDGDTITFDNSSLTDDSGNVAVNDMSGLLLAGVRMIGTSYYPYHISGTVAIQNQIANESAGVLDFSDGITLGSDLAVNMLNADGQGSVKLGSVNLGNRTLTINATSSELGCGQVAFTAIGGAGAIVSHYNSVVNFFGLDFSSFTGTVSADSGYVVMYNDSPLPAEASINISGTASLSIVSMEDSTVPTNLTLGGLGKFVTGTYPMCAGGGGTPTPYNLTLNGTVTLTSDFKYDGYDNTTITGTYNSNGHTFNLVDGASGSITTPQGSAQPESETITVTDSKPDESATVTRNQTYILDGSRNNIVLNYGATLKGIGIANTITANEGSTVSPGHSPGKLTVLNNLYMQSGSTYFAELLNKDSYDQLVVGNESQTSGNPVSLNSATLDARIYEGFKISATDTFTIIDNKSKTDVEGTFKNLPEGATFKVSDGVFKITYKGGDGNDVVLSVISVPTVPNTGFAVTGLNPIVTLISVAIASASILMIARYVRRSQTSSR